MKKIKNKYHVWFGDNLYETFAVSEKQAINNVKYQLGYANSYRYHEINPTKIETFETKIIKKRKEEKYD